MDPVSIGILLLSGTPPGATLRHPTIITQRQKLCDEGARADEGDFLVFRKDVEFKSPSAAAGVVLGRGAAGPREWRTEDGTTPKDTEKGI